MDLIGANQRPGVDAGRAVLFAVLRPLSRATQAGCWAAQPRMHMTQLVIPLAAVFLLGCSANRRPQEPSYKGTSLSDWFERLPGPAVEFPQTNEAIVALRSMGTNALPFMLRAIASGETNKAAWKAVDGFYCLKDVAGPAVPELAKLLHDPARAWPAAEALGYLGRDGFQALALGLTNASSSVRYKCALTFSGGAYELGIYSTATNTPTFLQFQRDASVGVPALVAALQRPDNNKVHIAILMALGQIRQSPEMVVPVLRAIAEDPSQTKGKRRNAELALAAFGEPEATASK